MTETLPNCCRGCMPHRDIREDRVSEALFAVNLSRAIALERADKHRDPARFFERTRLTRTLQGLIRDVLNTLGGQPGVTSVIHLQANFGGGKTLQSWRSITCSNRRKKHWVCHAKVRMVDP